MEAHEVLGLSRTEAADPTAVKRAYARLLKQHRPDRDPVGFQRLRAAYLQVCEQEGDEWPRREHLPPAVAAALRPTDQPPAPPSVPVPAMVGTAASPTIEEAPQFIPSRDHVAPKSMAAPDSWQQCEATLASHLAAGANDVLCLAAAQVLLQVAGEDGEARLRALRLLVHHLRSRSHLLDSVLSEADMVALAESGDEVVVFHMLERWEEAARWGRLARYGQLIHARLRAGYIEHAWVAAQLGMRLASREPAIAATLLAESYPELNADQRQAVDRSDHALAIGRDMQSWSPGVRHALVTALDHGTLPADPVFTSQVKRLLSQLEASSVLMTVVRQRLPALAAQVRHRVVRTQEASTFGGRFLFWMGVVLLIGLVRLCSSDFGRSHERKLPRLPPPTFSQPAPGLTPPMPLPPRREGSTRD